MIKTEKMYGFIQSAPLEAAALQQQIDHWLVLVRVCYQPTAFYVDQQLKRTYDYELIKKLLQEGKDHASVELIVTDGENESSIHIVQDAVLQRHLLTKQVFDAHRSVIQDYFDTTMVNNGLFAYIRPYDEYLVHNVENIEKRKNFQSLKEIESLPKRKNIHQEIVIDCNQFAGYDVFYNGYTLTSCWRMYFSAYYEQIIPRVIIMDTQQVESINLLDQNVVLVELYRHPDQWDHEVNLSYQQLFRDQTGIDQLAWDNGVGVFREPFIEYAYGPQIIQTIQYQNDQMQPTTKRKATHFVTRSFDLVQQNYQERRVKGYLNAQAYFPWIDRERLRMMDYIVLQPELTLDNGIEAYAFYIRNHLEVAFTDDAFKDYTACLQFYLPSEALVSLPIEALKDTLSDIHFGYLHRNNKYTRVTLKKNGKKLRVYFMNVQKLVEQQILAKHP